jgi:hypothetical protein
MTAVSAQSSEAQIAFLRDDILLASPQRFLWVMRIPLSSSRSVLCVANQYEEADPRHIIASL